jgi:PKD repeat protein
MSPYLSNPNIPPIANAGLDQVVRAGDMVQFDGSASYDPDAIISFGANIKVDDGTSVQRYSSIAGDNRGNPYVVWWDQRNSIEGDIYFARSLDGGQSFEANVKVNDIEYGMYPDIVVDNGEVIHVVWREFGIRYSKSTDGGASFTSPIRVDDGNGGFSPAIAVDSLGNPHVVWEDKRNGNYDIYYTNSIDGGDSFGLNVRVNSDSGNSTQSDPDIDIDRYNLIHVVWSDKRNGNTDIYYSKSTDSGKTFETDIKVNDDSGTAGQGKVSVAADSYGNPHIAWQDTRNGNVDIFYANSIDGGQSFEANVQVNDDVEGIYQAPPSIAVDNRNIAHISWNDARGGDRDDSDIYYTYSVDRGLSFTSNRKVNDDGGSVFQGGASIAADNNGSLHISWTDDRNGYQTYDIYYAKGSFPELFYDWDFDDGSQHGIGMRPTHVYNNPGIYNVTLIVNDEEGGTATDYCIITVLPSNQPPIAITGDNQVVNEGETVQFNGNDSYDPDGLIVSYIWDFNGDGVSDAMGSKPIHIYGDDGIYNVSLKVTDNDGLSDTDTIQITVNNVAPTIEPFGPFIVNEGSQITITAIADDQGSDDLTFAWEFELGSTIVNSYYNDDIGPDPYPSPHGTYPFSATDNVEQTYGDDGVYGISLKVEDDDGGTAYINTTVTVNNIAPGITMMVTPSGDEGSYLTFEAEATDFGSDDLTFEWEFEYGPTIENTYYNDGIGPEPVYDPITNEVKSPDGVYPFSASDTVTHAYGDDYNYTLILSVTDDDGGTSIYATTIEVDNLAPSIILFAIPYMADEGFPSTFIASAKDHGSDDLTFEWDFGDSTPRITNTYLNDGITPDTYPSPDGIFPFTANDTIDHTYGDDYNYTLSLKVTDDDGGITTFATTVIVQNVAPTIEPFGPFTIDEGSPLDMRTTSTDLGSDDLKFTWEFEHGPTITNIYYNDGIGPDPYPSSLGTFPFTVSDMMGHTYGDNGVFLVTLTVEDDDGGVTIYTTNTTVNNVAPTIESIEGYILANFTLRVAGEKWHNVELFLYEDDREIGYAEVIRFPGNPDDQSMTIGNVRLDTTKAISVKVLYTPDDDPVNGQPNGASPCWVNITFEEGSYDLLHHTFNVRHPETWEWNININQYFIGHVITFEATATDSGSDDLTFQWSFGSITTYYNDGISPDPFPSPDGEFPFLVTDVVAYVYIGAETIALTVNDDDHETDTLTINLA